MKTAIVGFGNDILGDDGIGIYLARDIAGEINQDFIHCSMYGLGILSELVDYDRVFIIDSVVQENSEVGSVIFFTMDDFKNCRHLSSPHTTDFATGINFGRQSGLELPEEIHIYGVTVSNVEDFSESLTPILKEKYPNIKKKIKADIEAK